MGSGLANWITFVWLDICLVEIYGEKKPMMTMVTDEQQFDILPV